jgi:MFS family permease
VSVTTGRSLLGINVLWIPLAFLYDGLTVLVLPIRLGADATAIGLVSFVGLLAAALTQPLAGWASDRLRTRLDRRAFLTIMAIPVGIGLWLIGGSPAPIVVVVGYVLVQVAASALQAGHQSLLPERVRVAARGRAAGLKTAFDVGGSFMAFVVLGMLLGSRDVASAALVTAVILVVGIGLVWLLVPVLPSTPSSATVMAPARAIPAGFVPLVLSRFLFLLGTYAVGRFLVLLVAERLGIDPMAAADEAGGLLASFALSTAAAALAWGWVADRRPRRDVMLGGTALATVGVLALVPAAGVGGVVLGGLLMAVGTAGFMSANWAATADLADPAEAGRLLGLANLSTALAAAAAGLLGPLIPSVGFAPVLVVAAVASAAASLPLVASQRRSTPRLEEAI